MKFAVVIAERLDRSGSRYNYYYRWRSLIVLAFFVRLTDWVNLLAVASAVSAGQNDAIDRVGRIKVDLGAASIVT